MSKVLIMVNSSESLLNFRFELITKYLEEGHELYISSPPGNALSKLTEMGCKCVEESNLSRHGMNPVKELKLLKSYKKTLKQIRPDVVFSYTIKPNIYGGMACKSLKIPFVPNVTGLGTSIQNGGIKSKIMLFLYKQGLKKAQTVFFQNSSNMDAFKELNIVKSNALLLPGSGVNLEKHCYVDYPKCEEPLVFTFVGRLMRDKGIIEFVKSADFIKKKHGNIVFQAVGSCEKEFELQLDELKKLNCVEFLGYRTDVHDIVSKSHAVVLPSYHEGLANVLLESAACGRPVVASRIPGCKETFEEGVSGFGCEPHDVDSLIQAIEKIIETSNEQRSEMGKNGRALVERVFDRKIVVNLYLNEIDKAIKEKEKTK